jgi:hypothetical protein
MSVYQRISHLILLDKQASVLPSRMDLILHSSSVARPTSPLLPSSDYESLSLKVVLEIYPQYSLSLELRCLKGLDSLFIVFYLIGSGIGIVFYLEVQVVKGWFRESFLWGGSWFRGDGQAKARNRQGSGPLKHQLQVDRHTTFS